MTATVPVGGPSAQSTRTTPPTTGLPPLQPSILWIVIWSLVFWLAAPFEAARCARKTREINRDYQTEYGVKRYWVAALTLPVLLIIGAIIGRLALSGTQATYGASKPAPSVQVITAPATATTDSGNRIVGNLSSAWHEYCTTKSSAAFAYTVSAQGRSTSFFGEATASSKSCGDTLQLTGRPTLDPQAQAGLPIRWYDVTYKWPNGSVHPAGAMLFTLTGGHWLLQGDARDISGNTTPTDQTPAAYTTGEAIGDDPTAVATRMEALREQAFLQHSTDLIGLYWSPANGSDALAADKAAIASRAKAAVPSNIQVIRHPLGLVEASVSYSGTVADHTYVFNPQINLWVTMS